MSYRNQPSTLSKASANTLKVPPCLLVFLAIVALMEVVFAVVMIVREYSFYKLIFGFVMLLCGLINAVIVSFFYASPTVTASKSIAVPVDMLKFIFHICTSLTFGCCLSAGFLESSLYTGSDDTTLDSVAVSLFFISSIFQSIIQLVYWKVVCSKVTVAADDSTSATEEVTVSAAAPLKFRVWDWSVAVLSTLVFSLSHSRLLSQTVPGEGIVGIMTSVLMSLFYLRRFRQSGWYNLVCLIHGSLLLVYLLATVAMYARFARDRTSHMQYGISLLLAVIFVGLHILVYTMKFCLLHEKFDLALRSKTPSSPSAVAVSAAADVSLSDESMMSAAGQSKVKRGLSLYTVEKYELDRESTGTSTHKKTSTGESNDANEDDQV